MTSGKPRITATIAGRAPHPLHLRLSIGADAITPTGLILSLAATLVLLVTPSQKLGADASLTLAQYTSSSSSPPLGVEAEGATTCASPSPNLSR